MRDVERVLDVELGRADTAGVRAACAAACDSAMPLPYMPRIVCTIAVGIRGPPEPPIASSTTSPLRHDRRRHVAERTQPRCERVELALDQRVPVRDVGQDPEVIDRVVEQHPGSCGDQLGAEQGVQAVRVRDRHPRAVDRTHVGRVARRVAARAPGASPTRPSARSSRSIDPASNCDSVNSSHRAEHVGRHDRGIARELGAQCERDPERASEQLVARGRTDRKIRAASGFEQREADQHDEAATRRQRRRHDVVTEDPALIRLAPHRPVVAQVLVDPSRRRSAGRFE